jgi:MFS family permease
VYILINRIILGFGCGLATVLVPLYLAEIAPASMKKSLGIANQFFIVVGILTGQSLSLPLGEPKRWRWVFMVSVGLAVIQLIGSFLLPSHEDAEVGDEDRPLLPQETADEGESMSIRELFVSKDTAVRRGCKSIPIL